jgi:hypothetical protein
MLALAFDPSQILVLQGLSPDPWQRDFLLCLHQQVLLCCSRGAGKSDATSPRPCGSMALRPSTSASAQPLRSAGG